MCATSIGAAVFLRFFVLVSTCIVCTTTTGTPEEVVLSWLETQSNITRVFTLYGDPLQWTNGSQSPTTLRLTPPTGDALSGTAGFHLVVDPITSITFWSDIKRREITATKHQSACFFQGISPAVTGLAIDWLSRNIYWSDSAYNWVVMAAIKYTPAHYRIVADTELEQPSYVNVDPQSRYIFWCDIGAVPKVERATLSGDNRTVIVIRHLWAPSAMTLDRKNRLLYWTEPDHGTLNWVDYNGAHRRVSELILTNENMVHLSTGLAIFEDFVFVSEESVGAIHVFNRTNQAFIGDIWARPRGITVGYLLVDVDDTSPCSDLNCEHICINKDKNRASCYCSQGYHLRDDDRSCTVSTGYKPPQLIYSNSSSLCALPHNVADISSIDYGVCFYVSNRLTRHLSFNTYSDTAYFVQDGHILKLRLTDGEKPKILIGERQGNIQGLAVDWVNLHLYWTNSKLGILRVSDLDGYHQRTLVEGLALPSAVVVIPSRKSLFWITNGASPGIDMAQLDGSHHTTLLSTLQAPSDLATDVSSETLFWSDAASGTVESYNLLTKRRTVIVTSSVKQIIAVTIHRDYVVWATANEIHFSLKDSRKRSREPMTSKHGLLQDVASYDTSAQPLSPSVCSRGNNGGCDHLCFPTQTGRSCLCASGYVSNNSTCTTELLKEEFVIVSDYLKRTLYQISLKDTSDVRAVPLSPVDNVVAVEYDVRSEIIYWTDVQARTIKRANLNGSNERVVVVLDSESIPSGLTADFDKDALFYTDVGHHTINSLTTIGSRQRVIAKNIFSPRAVTVCTRTRIVYFATQGPQAAIHRLSYSGSHLKTLVNASKYIVQPNGLAVDYHGHRLYWTDGFLGTISSVTLDGGTERKLNYHRTGAQPFGLFLHGQWLYFGDWSNGVIYKVHYKTKVTSKVSVGTFARPNDIVVCSQVFSVDPEVADIQPSDASDMPILIICCSLIAGAVVLICVSISVAIKWSRRCRMFFGIKTKPKHRKKSSSKRRTRSPQQRHCNPSSSPQVVDVGGDDLSTASVADKTRGVIPEPVSRHNHTSIIPLSELNVASLDGAAIATYSSNNSNSASVYTYVNSEVSKVHRTNNSRRESGYSSQSNSTGRTKVIDSSQHR